MEHSHLINFRASTCGAYAVCSRKLHKFTVMDSCDRWLLICSWNLKPVKLIILLPAWSAPTQRVLVLLAHILLLTIGKNLTRTCHQLGIFLCPHRKTTTWKFPMPKSGKDRRNSGNPFDTCCWQGLSGSWLCKWKLFLWSIRKHY